MPSARAELSALSSATPSQGSFAYLGDSSAELKRSEIRVRVGARSIIEASPGDCTVIFPLPVRERFETGGGRKDVPAVVPGRRSCTIFSLWPGRRGCSPGIHFSLMRETALH